MRTTSGNGATLRLHYRPGWLLFYRHKEDSRLGAQCTIGGRASETECALPLTVFPHARTQQRARVCTCATPLTCNTRPRMHTKATQTVTNACSPCTWWGRVQASFGPENLPTFLVARANECTSVRRNFGGWHPFWWAGRGRRIWTSYRVRAHGLPRGWKRDGATYNRFRGEDGEEGDDERSAEAFRIPARSELGVGELMVVRLCYSGGAAFSLHLLYRDSALHRPDCLGYRVLLPVSKQRLHAWIGRGRKNSICAVFGKHRATPFDALDSLRWTILIAPFR